MRTKLVRITIVALAMQSGMAFSEDSQCGNRRTVLPKGIADQITGIDDVIASLRDLVSRAQHAHEEINRVVSAGDTEPALFEQMHLMEVREREIARQIDEFQKLREQLCTMGSHPEN
jgi:hypothetical protein